VGKKSEAAQAELDAYRRLVRDEAYRVAKENGWCDSGLRQSLERLGLEPKQLFRVQIRAQRTAEFSMSVAADSEAEARQLLRDEPQRMREYAGTGYTSFEVIEPATAPTGADTPQVGQRRPAEGTWYATSVTSGGPNQCRVWNSRHTLYCTRPADHPVDLHVAAGNSAGVLDVWAVGPFDQRGTEFDAPGYRNDTDDDDTDGDDD
jgi:hypothetical protein